MSAVRVGRHELPDFRGREGETRREAQAALRQPVSRVTLVADHDLGEASAPNIDVALRMVVVRVETDHPAPERLPPVWRPPRPPHDLELRATTARTTPRVVERLPQGEAVRPVISPVIFSRRYPLRHCLRLHTPTPYRPSD